jgi:hypothetical protein
MEISYFLWLAKLLWSGLIHFWWILLFILTSLAILLRREWSIIKISLSKKLFLLAVPLIYTILILVIGTLLANNIRVFNIPTKTALSILHKIAITQIIYSIYLIYFFARIRLFLTVYFILLLCINFLALLTADMSISGHWL